MSRRLALAALLVAPAALAGSATAPGVTPGSILIGGISDGTARGAALTRGAAAYVRYVNERGGVNGRTIEYRVLDDGGDTALALEGARRLVRQDKVFALFGTVGTSTSLAIRDFLNRSGVPQLFVASGATTWGRDANRFPWTIGFAPSFRLEGTALGRQVAKTRPRARIAVLYQDGEDGRDLLAGLRRGLGARAAQLATAGYDPAGADVNGRVAELRATKADTLFLFALGRFAAGALAQARRLGWRPQVYVDAAASGAVATPGAVSAVFVKDPGDPRWAGDPGIALFQRVLKKSRRAADARNADSVAGMASAFTLVGALRKAGKRLSRAGLMAAVRSLDEANNPFVLPGIVIRTSPTDAFPIQQLALQRSARGHWNVFTGPLAVTG